MKLLDDKLLRRIHHSEHEGMYLHELAKMYHVRPGQLKKALTDWRVRNGKQGRVTGIQMEKAAQKAAPYFMKSWRASSDQFFKKDLHDDKESV